MTVPAPEPRAAEGRPIGRLGILFALALLATVVGIAYERLAQLRVDAEWSDRTHLVIETVDRTRVALLAADGMRRNYRLSFDAADRATMEARLAESGDELEQLAALTSDNAVQEATIAKLRPLIRERAEILRTGIDLPRTELQAPDVREEQRAIQGRGAARAKEIRVLFDAMLAEERRLLAERQARALATARTVRIAILLGGVVGLGLVVIFYVSLERENRRRRRAQADVERASRLVSAVVEGTSDLVSVKDRAGRYELANGPMARYFGRSVEEVIGLTNKDLLPPEAAETITANDREVLAAGEARVFETELTHGGETRTFLATKAPHRDAGGAIIGVITVSREITERKRLELKVREQAIRDPLTGLYNRGYLDETLAREIGRAKRRGAPVSVMMIDLDHFKRLNDTRGHAAGDAVLRRLGETLRERVRREDIPCRYGGEEIAVILPEMPLDVARSRAEQFRELIERLDVVVGDAPLEGVSASIGVATFPGHGATAEELLATADRALYRAKAEGRNRVVVGEAAE